MSKTVTNYFLPILKRQKKLLFLYTVIGFVAFPLVALISNNYDYGLGVYEFSLIINAVFMVACVMILPIIINKFSLNKRSVDTYYALPISRQHLFDVHYFAGVVCIYVPLLINYVLGILILTLRYGFQNFSVNYFMAFIGIIIITMAIYSINTLIVTKANNIIDSAILIAAYTILPFILIVCAMSFVDQFTVGYSVNMFDLSKYFPYLCPLSVLDQFIGAFNRYARAYEALDFNIMWFVYEAVIAVGFYIWSAAVFKKRKGEGSEQVSNDFFTYPLVVNLTSVILLSFYILDFSEIIQTIAILVITFIVYLIMHFISRRSMKVTPALIIKYFVILAAFNIFAFAARETYFFGINLRTPDISSYTEMEVSYWDYMGDSDKNYYAVIPLKNMDKNEEEFVKDVLALQKVAAEQKRLHPGYSYYYDDDLLYFRVGFSTANDEEYKGYSLRLPKADFKDLLNNSLFEVTNNDKEAEATY